VSPPFECPHGARCGGCTELGVPYPEQLEKKRARVQSALLPYPALVAAPLLEIRPASPVTEYRTRIKWMVGPQGELGLYARGGGHDVVDLPGCGVIAPVLARVGEVVRQALREGAFAAKGSPRGALRAIDAREIAGDGTASALLTLAWDRDRAPGPEAVREIALRLTRAEERIAGVASSLVDPRSPQVLGPRALPVLGASEQRDRIGSTTAIASFGSFVQAHRGQAAAIQEELRALLPRHRQGKRPWVIDLYGGSGWTALAMAEAGADVSLVESYGPAAESVLASAKEKRLAVEAIARKVEDALSSLLSRGLSPELAIVNPPRRGISPDVRRGLARLSPGRIAYVSCEPTTLARDLDHLIRLGYAPERLQPFDMMPHTSEVETLAVLSKAEIPPPVLVHEDEELLVVLKSPHEPTIPQGEHAGSLFDRVRRLPGCAEAVPLDRLDVGTSGVCLFARRASLVPAWSGSLAAGQKTYQAMVRGIPPSKGAITFPLKEAGKMVEATTRYVRQKVVGGHGLLEVFPQQARAHQVRRHLAALGHPVLGDERYGHEPTNRHMVERHGLDRTFLHLARLSLIHPRSSAPLVLEAPLAPDLVVVLEKLSLAPAPPGRGRSDRPRSRAKRSSS
jgi:23S rRNA (uracil1939-C5)-methyltransferase